MNHPTPTASGAKPVWRIGWPLLIAQTAQMGTGVVDTIMAARFGDKDLAAIAIGFNIWLPLYLVVLGVIFASSTIIAQDLVRVEYNAFGTIYRRPCGCPYFSV